MVEIKTIDGNDSGQVCELTKVINQAFFDRTKYDSKINYAARTEQEIQNKLKSGTAYAAYESGRIVGGILCTYVTIHHIKIAKLNCLCVLPELQGQGIAKHILRFVENCAKNEAAQLLKLDTGNLVIPAVRLYKSQGFLPIKVYANEPGTYYFVRYIKSIPPYKFNEFKRKIILLLSKVKFKLLFSEDSTPKKLCLILCGRSNEKCEQNKTEYRNRIGIQGSQCRWTDQKFRQE